MRSVTALKEQIEARTKESRDKDIDGKARTIARALGSTRGDDDGHTSTFKDPLFEIEAGGGVIRAHDGDMGWSCTVVQFNGTPVYEERGLTISTFIPGEWEEPFNALYARARVREEELALQERAKLDRERQEKETQERAKWGL